ncbi:hypothetical protein WDZ16_01140 [Pseudokineococcus marinus]|uniref:Uncharacterized protein n=1 Tax=Pseudokineococcus marinus TaxID=351215 RepID=A0A849BWR0_9ACTN|nr:hypothetical protein [Pseudokineococcus marinus]NNH23906.1 hypothetical protein [Pseudokineococcus marinus]
MVLRTLRDPEGGPSRGVRVVAVLLVLGLVAALIPTLVPVLRGLLELFT